MFKYLCSISVVCVVFIGSVFGNESNTPDLGETSTIPPPLKQ